MRRLLPLLLALLVVLSGCNGIGLPGSSNDPGTTAPNATNATATPGTPGANVTGESVKADALAALDGVETYRLNASLSTRYQDLAQTDNATVNGSFNRTARDLSLNQSQATAGYSFTAETYIDGENGTFYQYSPVYAQQYDSNWVSADISGNVSAVYAQYDTLARQRALLDASNVTLDGIERVNGTDAYVLSGTPDESRYDELGIGAGGRTNVSNISATFYVSVEDATLVRSTMSLEGTQLARGRTLAVRQTATLQFTDYGERVTVRLPDGVKTAVSVGNGTGVGS